MVFVVIPAIFHILGPLLQTMACRRIHVDGARVLGLTFKESVRNTRVVDILRECEACNVRTGVHDLWIDAAEAQHEYGITPAVRPQTGVYDAVIVTVAQRNSAQWERRHPCWASLVSMCCMTSNMCWQRIRQTCGHEGVRDSRARSM